MHGFSFVWVHYRNTIGTIALPYTEAKGGTIDEQKGSKTDRHIIDTFMFFFCGEKSCYSPQFCGESMIATVLDI